MIKAIPVNVVSFKSIPENYRKEYLGIKNNTLRCFPVIDGQDKRKDLLDSFRIGEINHLIIEIKNSTQEGESFAKSVRDVTYFQGYYIITWKE